MVALDEEGVMSASEPKVSRAAGTFDTASEAAVARDLALMWRQLGLGQPLESVDGHERFNLPPARLQQEEVVLVAQVEGCASWENFRALLKDLDAQGELARLAGGLARAPAAGLPETGQKGAPIVPPRRSGTTRQTSGGGAAAGAAGAAVPAARCEGIRPVCAGMRLRRNNRWQVRARVNGQQMNIGCYGSEEAAAVARDLALSWHKLKNSAQGAGPQHSLTFSRSLLRRKGIKQKLQGCASMEQLRALLKQLDRQGELARLAASLTANLALPAASGGGSKGGGKGLEQRSRGKRRRPREADAADEADDKQEGEGQALLRQGIKGEPLEAQQAAAAAAAAAGRHGGAAAVGRRLRVWLKLDDQMQQQHEGTVWEYTPTGKHHVMYDDGEQGLVDMGDAEFEYLPSPPSASSPAAAAAAAAATAAEARPGEAAASAPTTTAAAAQLQLDAPGPAAAADDVGRRLHVWWPLNRVWYSGVVTHVLRNGLLCVLYDLDGMELLVDLSDSKVQWAWLPLQKLHERQVRARERQQRQERRKEERRRQAKQGRRRQRRETRGEEEAPQEEEKQQQQQQQQTTSEQTLKGSLAAKGAAKRRRVQPFPQQQVQPQPQQVQQTQLLQQQAGEAEGQRPPLQAPAAGAIGAPTSAVTRASPDGTSAATTGTVPGQSLAGAAAGAAAVALGAEADLFEALLEAARTPEASACHLDARLVAAFVIMLDEDPPHKHQAKERRLRMLLAGREYGAAAALMRTSLQLLERGAWAPREEGR